MRKFIWYLWTGFAALWNTSLTAAGQGYAEVTPWLLGSRVQSAGCLDGSGHFQGDIYKCYQNDETFVMNLVRPHTQASQVVWYEKTSGGVDWTATITYYVPSGFGHYRDLKGHVYPVVNGQVTVGASPIMLEK